MINRCLIAVAVVFAISFTADAAPRRGAKPGFGSRVHPLATNAVNDPAPGVIVGVAAGGRTLHDAGYGIESVDSANPAWSGSNFQIGSVTKQMTAAGILTLQQDGYLSLDDDVREWIPELDTRGHAVTIRHLLNHTSGVPEYLSILADPWSPITAARVILLTNALPWASPPGARFSYNNTGYWLAGEIITRASGRPWFQYLRERLFLPAGMTSTAMCGTEPFDEVPLGHVLRNGSAISSPAVGMTVAGAAASICSTTGDLLRWNEALWHGSLLSDASRAEMIRPALLTGSTYPYGLGIAILRRSGRTVYAHGGSIQGFQSDLLYDPVDRLSIAVLMNITSDGAPATKLAEQIYTEWRRYAAARGAFEASPSISGSAFIAPSGAGEEPGCRRGEQRTTRVAASYQQERSRR